MRFILGLLIFEAGVWAQQPLTLAGVVEAAAKYPSIRAGTERVNAAAAGIRLARTAYLPRLDGIALVNRGTRNNIFGMLMPQSVLPTISGPPLLENSLTSVWGSAVGLGLSWEPFDFGLRKAQVDRAMAERERAAATVKVTELEVRTQAADAFLTALAAEQTVHIANAAVERARVISELVQAQVNAELRPGADASRALAELAAARNQLIQAQRAAAEGRVAISLFTGAEATALTTLNTPPAEPAAAETAGHPRAIEQQRAVEEAEAARRILDRSWYPRFNVQAASYARGSGAMPDGTTLGGVHGLGPNIHNWGAGFTVTFPTLDFLSLAPKKEVEDARIRIQNAQVEQVRREIDMNVQRAKVQLTAARQMALNTPAQLDAARAAERQAGARYRAGLGTLAEVAEAQRLVAQAEIDDSLARLNIWRGMLAVSYAQGDLQPFLEAAGK